MASLGLFGLKLGMIAPVMTLILHLIWERCWDTPTEN
jgi:hypothetical protein